MTNAAISTAGMTARQVIERRLGRAWPVARDLAPDQRRALYLLALELNKQRLAGVDHGR